MNPIDGATVDDSNLIGAKLGNYRLLRLLGRGRMGVVYLARDEALLRPTAVKILSWASTEHHGEDPEAWFLSEARHVARINHPNVVHIYGVAKHGTHRYIAMEYVEGAPADSCIAEHGPFAPDRATEILIQTAAALQAAHDAGVVHRDVKPGNVLIGLDGSAKLGDFGMALDLTGARAEAQVRAGTPFYTAPEIWCGQPASPKTDIYALGATYFYLLTGRPPMSGADLQSLIAAHLHADIPDLREFVSGIPAGCNELVRRCLARSAEERFDSAQSLGWEARGLLRSMTGLSRTRTTVPPAPAARPASIHPHKAPPEDAFMSFFGLITRPFGRVDPLRVPYEGEPFKGLRDSVGKALLGGGIHALILVGENGSGRTTLLHQLSTDHAPSGPVAFVGGEENRRSLLQRVGIALSGEASPLAGVAGGIDALLAQLESEVTPPLLVLDAVNPSRGWLEEAALLVRAAAASRCFRVVMTGSTDLAQKLTRASHQSLELSLMLVNVPPLSARETLGYLLAWLGAAQGPAEPDVVVTPDAAFLVRHRTQGNLGLINRVASKMLVLAAADERRLLSSWDAFRACALEIDGTSEAVLERPSVWPTSEVLQILNSCRKESGIALRLAAQGPDGMDRPRERST